MPNGIVAQRGREEQSRRNGAALENAVPRMVCGIPKLFQSLVTGNGKRTLRPIPFGFGLCAPCICGKRLGANVTFSPPRTLLDIARSLNPHDSLSRNITAPAEETEHRPFRSGRNDIHATAIFADYEMHAVFEALREKIVRMETLLYVVEKVRRIACGNRRRQRFAVRIGAGRRGKSHAYNIRKEFRRERIRFTLQCEEYGRFSTPQPRIVVPARTLPSARKLVLLRIHDCIYRNRHAVLPFRFDFDAPFLNEKPLPPLRMSGKVRRNVEFQFADRLRHRIRLGYAV